MRFQAVRCLLVSAGLLFKFWYFVGVTEDTTLSILQTRCNHDDFTQAPCEHTALLVIVAFLWVDMECK